MRLNSFLSLIICISLAFTAKAFADNSTPNLKFETLTIDDGLSNNNVGFRGDAILRDNLGYIWVATFDGLNRFDGYEFRNIRAAQDNSGLSDNIVYTIFEDKDDFIWIGTHSGLDRYDSNTEKFLHIDIRSEGVENASFISISQDKKGDIWAYSFDHGIFRFDPLGKLKNVYTHFTKQVGHPSSFIRGKAIETEGSSLLFPSSKGIESYSYENDNFQLFPLNKEEVGVRVLHQQENGLIWVGSEKGLFLFDIENGLFKEWKSANNKMPFHQFSIRDIDEDTQGNLWIALANNGVIKFQPKTETFQIFKYNLGKQHGLPTNNIFDIYIDKEQFLWLGTNIGVTHCSLKSQLFSFVENNKPVTALLVTSQNEQWIGSFGGGVTRITPNNKKYQYTIENSETNGLTSNTVFSLYEDNRNNIWLGTLRGGLLRYDRYNNKFVHYLSPNTVTQIKGDSEDTLWIGTVSQGLAYLEKGKLQTNTVENSAIKTLSISALYIDQLDKIWVGTVNGMYVLNRLTGELQHFEANTNENSIVHNFILTFHKDNKNNIMWIGTADGLSRFNLNTGKITNYQKKHGLPGNMVSAIQADTQGRLWIATNNGLSLLDPNTESIVTFNENDGLKEIDFTQNATSKTNTGNPQFGSATGYTEFSPLNISSQMDPPELLLTEFRIFNKLVDIEPNESREIFSIPKSISRLNYLNLSYRERFFSFKFSVTDAPKPKHILYSYKLEGWDNDWVESDHKVRIASYTNIPAGSYLFRVQAKDIADAWIAKSTPLSIIITPPLWKTNTAYFFYFIFCIAFILSLIKIRTNHLERRTKELNIAVNERTEEIEEQKKTIEKLMLKKEELFENISHEFRTPLTLILGPLNKVVEDENINLSLQQTLRLAIANGKKLLRMVDQLLDLVRLEKTPDLYGRKKINISKLVSEIISYFDILIKDKELDVKLVSSDEVWISIPFDSLEKILGNLISNSIKYSYKSGKIEIECKEIGNQACIIIRDFGPGIDKKYHKKIFERFVRVEQKNDYVIPGAGLGLALVKQLTESNNGSIRIESDPGSGATFVLEFPLAEKGYNEPQTLTDSIEDLELASTQYSLNTNGASKPQETDQQLPKLLVVEDHLDMQNYLTIALGPQFEFHYAIDGEEGIKQALQIIPDLIITDLMMPNINGFEFSKTIRDNISTSHIPIIMLTAKTGIQTRKIAWKTNIDEHIEKPFDPEELQIRCKNLLDIRKTISQRLNKTSRTDNNENLDFLNLRDKEFIEKLKCYLNEHYNDPELGAKPLSQALAMSESQLQRKTKALLNQSIPEYIRSYRLTSALELLKTGRPITDIAFSVGFSSSTYFSQCFKAEFGKSPKTMREEIL